MDIRFDSNAARKLLKEMDKYCSGINTNATDLLNVLNDAGEWNDNQMKYFQANMKELIDELNKTLRLEVDYMKTFYDRVKELED